MGEYLSASYNKSIVLA